MGRVWLGEVCFLDDNSFSHYKMGTRDVGKLRFSIYSLYRMGTYDVVHGCHPAGEYDYKIWLMVSTPLKNMKVTWGYYSQYMEIHKSHGPNHQPEMLLWSGGYPHFIEEIPKGISYINDVSVYLYTYDVCVNLTF